MIRIKSKIMIKKLGLLPVFRGKKHKNRVGRILS
jgi:hypothetical protein